MGKANPLVFMEKENGCIVQCSHALNHDGYTRMVIPNPHGKPQYMLHRAIYEARNGELPKGYEVDHLCGCRQCCNPKHLEAKPRKQHLIETNKSRYAARRLSALAYIHDNAETVTAKELVEMFNVSERTAYGWLNNWRDTH